MIEALVNLRAWDEGQKVMHWNVEFISSGNESNDWIVFKSDQQPLTSEPHPFQNPYFRKQIKIMEWVGFHNNKGAKIFTGDIMKTDSGLLVYVCWRYLNGIRVFVCRQSPDTASVDIQKAWDVVGNIYQTPELLGYDVKSIIEKI